MKQFFLMALFLSSSLSATEAYAVEKYKVIFDADGDGKRDVIVYSVQKNDMRNATVRVKISPTKAIAIDFTSDSYVYYEIAQCPHKKACIQIVNADYGIWSEGITSYYLYDRLRRSWFLQKEIVEGPVFDESGGVIPMKRDRDVVYYNMSKRIDGKIFPNFDAHPLHGLEKRVKMMSTRFANSINRVYFQYYLKNYPLSIKTVTLYNNIAFYLYKKSFNDEAIYILEKIVKQFPNRVVAYLNLGDAYYEENNTKYKEMYRIYIQLMKKKSKEKYIPKRVFSRR